MMSAITETEPGGEMVCIQSFSARPRDAADAPTLGPRRDFQVGERVRFISAYCKDTPRDNPTGYMAVFEPLDRRDKHRSAATQDYFVSLECWEGLRKHFASKLVVKMEWDAVVEEPEEGTYTLVELKQSIPERARKATRRAVRAHKDS